MRLVFLLLGFSALAAHAQTPEINRALIERDQQSAEFAAQLGGSQLSLRQLQNLHARQLAEALVPLSADPLMAQHFLPYQRESMARQRAQQRFESPVFAAAPKPAIEEPLPLPGGPKPGVDPVTPDGLRR